LKVIEVNRLSKTYAGGIEAVKGITFDVEEGEIFGFLGPNGAGKTTTIMMLTTLLTPTSGTAKVCGYDVVKDPNKVRFSIGYVSQDLAVDDALTGWENLYLQGRFYHIKRETLEERVDELLELLHLKERAKDKVESYSGGMRKRLDIAMGLIHRPKVLFLDEPTLGLDVQTRRDIWNYITRIRRESKMTIFLTTHYMEEADALCQRIAMMANGKIAVVDSPSNLKRSVGQGCIIFKLSAMPKQKLEIENCVLNGDKVLVYCKNPSSELAEHLKALEKAGCSIASVEVKETTLDDAFMKYVGRRMVEMEQWSATRKIRRVARRLE